MVAEVTGAEVGGPAAVGTEVNTVGVLFTPWLATLLVEVVLASVVLAAIFVASVIVVMLACGLCGQRL